MIWKPQDIPSLIHHLPQAVHGLIAREDKNLVDAAAPLILTGAPVPPATGAAPRIALGKEVDPALGRDMQNMELLVHDWLHNLPDYDPEHEPVQRLVDHWRQILQEQPHRIAEAQQAYWKSEESKRFWHEKLQHYHLHPELAPEGFHVLWEDWERAAGINYLPPPPSARIAQEARHWQDLVIRSRMHDLTRSLISRS